MELVERSPAAMSPPMRRTRGEVLGALIDVLSWSDAVSSLVIWGEARASKYVCICNVHSVVTARQDPEFAEVIRLADMATPDGAPVAWTLRQQGHATQTRINGPDLMWRYLGEAERRGQVVFFYGSASETLDKLKKALLRTFPKLKIGGMESPPFRELSAEEDQAYVDQINAAGTAVVFVGLGCPKQEKWMAAHKGRIHAVMVGVGAAFDYHAGTIQRAPMWMQRNGLEWLHRLASEPKRLWKRYLVTNTVFVVQTSRALVSSAFAKTK